MGTLAAIAHTYYLARWDRCFGAQQGQTELCSLLKSEWQKRAAEGTEPTIVDGLSAWLDRQGAVHVCLVQMGTAHMLSDDDLARKLEPYLKSPAPASRPPEHPPAELP